MRALLPAPLAGVARRVRDRIFGPPRWLRPFIRGLYAVPGRASQPRCLLSYVTAPWEGPPDVGVGPRHSNAQEALEIARALGARGYAVDVAHVEDDRFPRADPPARYDLIVGQGLPFLAAERRAPGARRVIYLTEPHPAFAARREEERIAAYRARRGRDAPFRRAGLYIRPEHLDAAEAGIVLGGAASAATYAREGFPGPIRAVAPTGLERPGFVPPRRDCAETRRRFVWFGSWGAVLKGLDLLVEAVARVPEAHLHVCGLDPRERVLLEGAGPRVVDEGHVDVRSPRFHALVEGASFVALPSAAEGMSTGVLTCMMHGLIPVVTPEAGVDVEGIGVGIEGGPSGALSVEAVAAAIARAARTPPEEVQALHDRVLERARDRYRVEGFAARWGAALDEVLLETARRGGAEGTP